MIVRQMRDSSVQRTVELLLQLVAQEQWEVRHASLMGVQHLLAARSVSAWGCSVTMVVTPHYAVMGFYTTIHACLVYQEHITSSCVYT